MITTGATGLLVRPNCAPIACIPLLRIVAPGVTAFTIGSKIPITSGAVPTAVPVIAAMIQGSANDATVNTVGESCRCDVISAISPLA